MTLAQTTTSELLFPLLAAKKSGVSPRKQALGPAPVRISSVGDGVTSPLTIKAFNHLSPQLHRRRANCVGRTGTVFLIWTKPTTVVDFDESLHPALPSRVLSVISPLLKRCMHVPIVLSGDR